MTHRLSKFVAGFAALAILFGAGVVVSVYEPDNAEANPPYKMVLICHTDDSEMYHEIEIPKWQVPDHVAHGDIYPVPHHGCPKHEHPPPTTTEPPPTTTGEEPPPPTTTEEQPPPPKTEPDKPDKPDKATPPPPRPNGPGPPNTNLPHTGGVENLPLQFWIALAVGLGMLGAGCAAFGWHWKTRGKGAVG